MTFEEWYEQHGPAPQVGALREAFKELARAAWEAARTECQPKPDATADKLEDALWDAVSKARKFTRLPWQHQSLTHIAWWRGYLGAAHDVSNATGVELPMDTDDVCAALCRMEEDAEGGS